ncbi:MAG TPA: hypothetical protein PLW86_14430 [Rhodocyclaceae bacterium]|nr:hypothetical protein [Rhodocyclaceae bacterium]
MFFSTSLGAVASPNPKHLIAKTAVGLGFMLIVQGCILGKTLGLSKNIGLEYFARLLIAAVVRVQDASMC